MRFRVRFWLPIALSSALLFPSTATADTIRITSGFLELTGAFDLAGDRGFQLVGSGYGGGASASAYVFCDGDACNPGESAELRHAFGGLDLFVTSAALDGITYADVNSLSAEAFAEIGFSSTHVLPPVAATAVLTAPFMMEGHFSHPGGVETLLGSGIVTTTWVSSAGGGSGAVWNLGSARYDFSNPTPVPEPGTLALATIGGVAAAVGRRRRRARNAP